MAHRFRAGLVPFPAGFCPEPWPTPAVAVHDDGDMAEAACFCPVRSLRYPDEIRHGRPALNNRLSLALR